MKTIPGPLQTHLEGETTTLSLCWRIVKRNGVLITGTDHDQDVVITTGDLAGTYFAKSNILPSNVKSNSDLAVDNMEVTGAVGQDGTLYLDVSVDDIESRNLEFAAVKTFFVNWADPDMGQVPMRTGFLGALTYDSSGMYKTEVRGLSQKLQQNIIQTYSDKCTVIRFGDTRCGIDAVALTINVTAASVTSRRVLTVSGYTIQPTGYFTLGNLTCLTGLNAGVLRQVRVDTDGALDLFEAFPEDVEVGDTFTLSPGCDRLASTCLNKFDNLENFRGYGLLIPGIDALLSGVASVVNRITADEGGGAVIPVPPVSPAPVPPTPIIPGFSPGLGTAIARFQRNAAVGTDSGAFSYSNGAITITGNYNKGGIPGGHTGTVGGHTRNGTGPACTGCRNVYTRFYWKELEPTEGNYDFSGTDADLAQCIALGIQLFIMIEGKTFNSTNPAPAYLTAYTSTFVGLTTGKIIWRWNLPVVAPAFKRLVTALGNRYNGVAAFGGIMTQETAPGGTLPAGTGYGADVYMTALYAEHDAIALAAPDKPHVAFQNFINDVSNAAGDRKLDLYAAYIQKDKAILAGPDLVRGPSSVNSRCYPRAVAYHFGGTTPSGVVFPSTGPTGQSIQHSEWTGAVGPGPTPIPETMSDLFDIGTGVIHGVPNTQHCDYLWYDFETNTNVNGENYANACIPLYAANPGPIGTWTP